MCVCVCLTNQRMEVHVNPPTKGSCTVEEFLQSRTSSCKSNDLNRVCISLPRMQFRQQTEPVNTKRRIVKSLKRASRSLPSPPRCSAPVTPEWTERGAGMHPSPSGYRLLPPQAPRPATSIPTSSNQKRATTSPLCPTAW